jgi:hypothetical protein
MCLIYISCNYGARWLYVYAYAWYMIVIKIL